MLCFYSLKGLSRERFLICFLILKTKSVFLIGADALNIFYLAKIMFDLIKKFYLIFLQNV